MSHLAKNILTGHKLSHREMKKEAVEELEEAKGRKRGKALAKALERKKGHKLFKANQKEIEEHS